MSFYVTTPIYYVNAQPHLGHAYTTIAADVLARHMRQRGEDVFFLTGTDEHGEPVADVAEREGIPPRELADRNVVHFKEMVERVNASNDFFIRTSDPEHGAAVQRFMQDLYDRGAHLSRAPTRAGTARAAPTSRTSRRSSTATSARSTRSS